MPASLNVLAPCWHNAGSVECVSEAAGHTESSDTVQMGYYYCWVMKNNTAVTLFKAFNLFLHAYIDCNIVTRAHIYRKYIHTRRSVQD